MPQGFKSLHFDIIEQAASDLRSIGTRALTVRGGGRPQAPTDGIPTFNSEEAAARFYLQRLLERQDRPSLRAIVAPDRPEVVPDLELRDTRRSALTDSWTVRFVQTRASIPVFGSRAVVELDSNRELLVVDADLAEVDDISPVAALSPAQALERIATTAAVPASQLAGVEAPKTTFYHDDDNNQWHLAYSFRNVPAAPGGFMESSKSHGASRSLAQRHPLLNYLVDAHDGRILLYWSAAPTATGVDIPVACNGTDEDGISRDFFGRLVAGGSFEMHDPMRNIRTHDFNFKDIENDPAPVDAIRSASSTFGTHSAAVSAHLNASRVLDFCKSVLMRDSLDDKGMEIVSFVNCTVPAEEPPPVWHNAAWWKQRMWYGQTPAGPKKLQSFARHLDIIAHELAHGLTEFTADLVYLKQPGALNESFSDIFGIIIRNWDWANPTTGGDVSNWTWEIGPGLQAGGLPLRDFSNPQRTGDPDHMNQYFKGSADHYGVHTNSNIHNKAAHNVFTAADAQQKYLFTPREVAVLYYLTLSRLSQLATFADALQTLLSVASTYFAGNPQRQDRIDGIRKAYAAVGIT
ncbi:MAG TPA: M4 family metallopeptidase [Thermoanaerobaculia bacterium]|nr:M4 family metallopeptidase [Thermoanaerobaculia bacterium]